MKLADWDILLWDLDGTLADTIPLIVAAYRHTMEVHHGSVPPDDRWLEHVGRPLRETLRDFTADADEAEALRQTYVGFQEREHDRMVRPYPGVVELVDELRRRRRTQALVTSKARDMALRTLGVCGLGDAFPVAVTADEVTRGKPDPEPVQLALRDLAKAKREGDVAAAEGMDDTRLRRVAFIGDSPHDVAAGRAAGVTTVAVTWGAFPEDRLRASGAHHVVTSVDELAKVGPPAP